MHNLSQLQILFIIINRKNKAIVDNNATKYHFKYVDICCQLLKRKHGGSCFKFLQDLKQTNNNLLIENTYFGIWFYCIMLTYIHME